MSEHLKPPSETRKKETPKHAERRSRLPETTKVEAEDGRELARELEDAERELQNTSHDAVAGFLTKLGKKKAAKWIQGGALLAALFRAETAMAYETERLNDMEQESGWDEEAFDRRMREEKERLLESPFRFVAEHDGHMTISVIKGQLSHLSTDWLQEINKGGQATFRAPQIEMRIDMFVTQNEVKMVMEPDKLQRLLRTEDLFSTSGIVYDEFGNAIDWFISSVGPDGKMGLRLSMRTPMTYAEEHEEQPSPVTISFGLNCFGFGEFKGAFVAETIPFVEKVGDYSVYRDGIEEERAESITARFGPMMNQGIERVRSLFGGEVRPSRILLSQGFRQNAAALQDGTIRINEQFFEPVIGQESIPGYQLEGVFAHEALHLADFEWSLSTDAEWVALFETTQGALLRSIEEESFSYGEDFGGHPESDPAEFFASFANSLDHPDWEKHMESKSKDEREFYLTALQTLHEILRDRMKEKGLATLPIVELIEQRIGYLI